MSDIDTLIVTVRDIMGKIKINVDAGQLVKVHEVGPNSFVQVMEAFSLIPGSLEPVGWQYSQFWVDKATKPEMIIGMYLNEWTGSTKQTKIIGIFEQAK